jgi:hypothetical protein
MIQWSTNHINPAVSARTTPAGTPRQSAATAAPIASRGAQFRAAALSRSAPTTTQRADKPDDEDDEKPKKEPLFSRDDAPNDDGLDNSDANETDTDPDEDGDEDKDVQIVVVS